MANFLRVDDPGKVNQPCLKKHSVITFFLDKGIGCTDEKFEVGRKMLFSLLAFQIFMITDI
jgi:hypothetical protein